MHVFKHPKYYDELRKKRKKFQKEQADKQASERASRGAGGPEEPQAQGSRASPQAIRRQMRFANQASAECGPSRS